MSDATGHMDRPGAGPFSSMMSIGGVPINHYIHDNPTTGMVEIVRPMPPGLPDQRAGRQVPIPTAYLERWSPHRLIRGRAKYSK